ncbi:MAG: hypothetical protein IJ033_06070 [Clostridia bacterium]|nr:hypothetical protein [Clostridia bacterium]
MIIIKAPDTLIPTLLQGSENTIKFLPVLFGSYCVFIPLIKILEKSKLDKSLAKLISPLNKALFPKEKKSAYAHLSLNLSTNLLGIGGASTPSGLKAMEEMTSKKNKIMLVVINSLSIQIIPTTVVAMRAAKGSAVDIILPSLLVTALTTVIGVVLVRVLVKE